MPAERMTKNGLQPVNLLLRENEPQLRPVYNARLDQKAGLNGAGGVIPTLASKPGAGAVTPVLGP
jgi:hypothetical protein